MPIPAPNSQAVEPDLLLEAMRADLASWATGENGTVHVAKDPLAVLTLLAETPSGFRVIIHLEGDANERPEMPAPVVKYSLKIQVSANMGLSASPDLAITQATANRPALLRLAGLVRKRVMSWRLPEASVHKGRVYYDGFGPVTLPDGLPLAAYELDFHFRAPITAAESTVEITLE
jgi:hypothetical protein